MSRSYHANRGYRNIFRGLDEEDFQQLRDKRKIKRQTRLQRKSEPKPVDTSPLSGVLIEVIDDNPWMLYPVSVSEIREVIEQIHDVNVAGLPRIGLCMGKEVQEQAVHECYEDNQVRDPIVGRKSMEWERGLYAPLVAGTYDPKTGKVEMYGYVITEDFVSDPRVIMELKTMFLRTLLHEIIHYRQELTAAKGGRLQTAWADRYEADARATAKKWFQDYAVPVLAAYSDPDIGD